MVSGGMVIDVANVDVKAAKRKGDYQSLRELYWYYKLVKKDDKAANYWDAKADEKWKTIESENK